MISTISFTTQGNSLGAVKDVVAMGQLEISPHPLGGEGLVQGTPCAVGVHSSEGWVSWEDPDWIPPNLSIPMVASWLRLGPALGWNSYSKAWAPSISPSQNKAHFNPFFLHAPDKAMPTGWTHHHSQPWAPPAQVGYPWQGRAPGLPKTPEHCMCAASMCAGFQGNRSLYMCVT